MKRNSIARIATLLWLFGSVVGVWGQPLPEFDFTRPEAAREWVAAHHISALKPTAEGLEIALAGDDPYFHGPARDYPTNTPLWLVVRLKAEQAGPAEVFYFREQPKAGQSVQFHVPAGRWVETRVAMPPLGAGFRLRIDPPGRGGKVVLASLRFEKRVKLAEPSWAWKAPARGDDEAVTSGELALFSSKAAPFGLELRVRGASMGFTHPHPRIACLDGDAVRWVELGQGAVSIERASGTAAVESRTEDSGGANWIYRQSFRAAAAGTIATETSVSVDQDRTVVFLPMHLLMAGEGSFGARKNQGLFAGLEYLDDEPSSSEADIIGPESNRRVPSSHKITMPLMAIQAQDRYVGLIWEDPRRFSALFDSPDRTFGSGGHALGVLFPGGAAEREEGSLMPYAGVVLKAGEPLVSRAWLIGGAAHSIVPAVQHYVWLRGLPELPRTGIDFDEYVKLASQSWLQSKIREENLYRHAFWPGFNPQPAADAALFQTWLAGQIRDATVANALDAAAREALSVVPPENYFHSAVSHVRTPAAPLVFGSVLKAVDAARQTARAQLGRFAADGSISYRVSGKGPDYGKTHFAPDANGLTAQVVATLLESAIFSGDRELMAQAIDKLRRLDKFGNTVPRGAQTWEVPLHTPDILASGYLVRAYTLGYELTGEARFREQAVYWAWTGVPFIYLTNPTGEAVGPYSTIAVLGATSWQAPVWFGRPVQWCGLAYGDALYRLARQDASGPWKQLADGIASAGLQHTWRADDPERVGLLPDFYELREQQRAGPAINPGTVGANAVRLYGKGPLYDWVRLRQAEILLHAPGEIVVHSESERGCAVTVRGWPKNPFFVLASGFAEAPRVKVNGEPQAGEFDARTGTLILKASGTARVEFERKQ